MALGDPRRSLSRRGSRSGTHSGRRGDKPLEEKDGAVNPVESPLPPPPPVPFVDDEQETTGVSFSSEEELKELKDRLLRVTAEFDNYRKRQARDFNRLCNQEKKDLIMELLIVLDNLDRAEELNNGSHPPEEISEGLFQTLTMLRNVLERDGLSEIKTEDLDAFDPNIHEAMIAENRDDLESDSVLQVLQKGYRLGSELIRPVRVRVGKAVHENGEEQ